MKRRGLLMMFAGLLAGNASAQLTFSDQPRREDLICEVGIWRYDLEKNDQQECLFLWYTKQEGVITKYFFRDGKKQKVLEGKKTLEGKALDSLVASIQGIYQEAELDLPSLVKMEKLPEQRIEIQVTRYGAGQSIIYFTQPGTTGWNKVQELLTNASKIAKKE